MRSGARSAVVRGELNRRNGDLFDFEATEPDLGSDHLYCHLLHGGYSKPTTIVLSIPNRNQRGYFAAKALEIVEPESVQVEEIREEVIVKLIELSQTKTENEAS